MVILHIYGARSSFLLFYDDQDTISTKCEIEMSISQLIFTHKTISKAIWDNDIHTLKRGRKITTENGPVLRHRYYMVHTGFIGLYVTVHTFAQ